MKHDHDRSVDRLLAGTLKARAADASGEACLDAETLAAWADDALDARERARAEAHAADCDRCQALLAAMVKTTTPSPATAAWWRMPALGWVVPLSVAATVLVIWIAVPNVRDRAPVQQPARDAKAVDQLAPMARSEPPAEARAKVEADGQRQPPRQVAKEKAAPPPAVLRERTDAPSANALSKAETVTATGAAPVAVAPPASNTAPPAAAPAAPPTPPQSAADSTLRAQAPFASARAALANPRETVVVSSDPATRFRLLRGGGVERSADAGVTWRTEVTGATTTLTAGSSPSPSVCWLIGPAGVVLLSTDGSSWRRLAFPETVDLRSVTATDSQTATVTTTDGRAFITTDGGQMWSRAPGP